MKRFISFADSSDRAAVPDARPTGCPACASAQITTTAKTPDANSYWRCTACGEVWNMSRRKTQQAALGADVALNRRRLIPELRELIAALDRRVPQVERAGEVSIAREAAALRDKAVQRIAELEAEERVRVASP